MPRLTPTRYLLLHDLLRYTRASDPVWVHFTPVEQWDIISFFALDENLSDPGLLEYRKFITKGDPSLPHRAGRAFARLIKRGEAQLAAKAAREAAGEQPGPLPAVPRGTRRPVRVRSSVNFPLDQALVAKVPKHRQDPRG